MPRKLNVLTYVAGSEGVARCHPARLRFMHAQRIPVGKSMACGHTSCDLPVTTHICRLLLDAGADIHIRDALQRTALYYAAEARDVKTCALLLDKGSCPETMYDVERPLMNDRHVGAWLEALMQERDQERARIDDLFNGIKNAAHTS